MPRPVEQAEGRGKADRGKEVRNASRGCSGERQAEWNANAGQKECLCTRVLTSNPSDFCPASDEQRVQSEHGQR
jgi:hypothetical protein